MVRYECECLCDVSEDHTETESKIVNAILNPFNGTEFVFCDIA